MSSLFRSAFISFFILILYLRVPAQVTENVILITIDGARWQDIFDGADPFLMQSDSLMKVFPNRQAVMPFFWSKIEDSGAIFGNRHFGNKMNVKNPYRISYPGYNEMLTGYCDAGIASNKARQNPNKNVLEFLDLDPAYHGKVAAFSSWNTMEKIVGNSRNRLWLNKKADSLKPPAFHHCRTDSSTFHDAISYMETTHPSVLFISFGETDEYAHSKSYPAYIQSLNAIDRFICRLWNKVQEDEFYRNRTAIMICTDHGRGKKPGKWFKHNRFVSGSSETWMAMLGAGIPPLGELKCKNQFYQEQIANTIAHFLKRDFIADHPVAEPIAGYFSF